MKIEKLRIKDIGKIREPNKENRGNNYGKKCVNIKKKNIRKERSNFKKVFILLQTIKIFQTI